MKTQSDQAEAIPPGVFRRKSVFVALGWYTKTDWHVRVLQISRKRTRLRCFRSCGNPVPGKPDHLNLRQVRSRCLAETQEAAWMYVAHLDAVRRLHGYEGAARLAERHRVSYSEASELLHWAVPVFGSYQKARLWLCHPGAEFNGRIPLRMARTADGQFKVENFLLRKRFFKLLKAKDQA